MPIQRRAANRGIFEPQDLSFLQSIFDESCAVHEHLSEEQSTAIARKLFVLFKGGTRDREFLKNYDFKHVSLKISKRDRPNRRVRPEPMSEYTYERPRMSDSKWFSPPVPVKSKDIGRTYQVDNVRAASEQMLEWAARGPEWRMGVEVCLAAFEGKRSAADARTAFEAAARESGMLVER